MANLFGSPKGRDDNDPIRRLQEEIEGTEYRKQVLVTAVQSEIQAEKQKISNELYQIGALVYESSTNGQDATDKVKAHVSAIDSYKEVIEEKEGRIADISKRYDEEVVLMRSQINMTMAYAQQQQQPPPPPQYPPQPHQQPQQPQQQYMHPGAQGGARCPKCGNYYTPGVHVFCDNCGNRF